MRSQSRQPGRQPGDHVRLVSHFVQTLLDNNAYTWFAPLITFGELAVGIGLLVGCPDGDRRLLRGAHEHVVPARRLSSTNPVLFTLAIGLILAWKVAGYYGLDRYLLPLLGTPWHHGTIAGEQPRSAASPTG